MALYDLTPGTPGTIEHQAYLVKHSLYMCTRLMRNEMFSINMEIAGQDKAAIVTALGGDAQTVVDQLDVVSPCLNTTDYRAPKDRVVVQPIVQADLP